MSQWRWTFYDPHEGTQTLGLYHGEESGHVMIYLNHKVVVIDFMVHESKSYSLVVNDLLVKLILKKNNGLFSYDFEGQNINPSLGFVEWIRIFMTTPFSVRSWAQ